MNETLLKKMINIPSPILIRGETGTGKSLLAKKIFAESKIFKEVFLTVHLASLKEDLIESELFGHRKGSFTGANEAKNGYLKDVGKGTLFLDEVGELSLEAQKKLLYLLEEKRFTPVGSTQSLPFEGRIIMATNRNLEKMVEEKTFREDLYFRMRVFQLELQPIKQDPNAFKQILKQIFEDLKVKFNRPQASLAQQTMIQLQEAEWRGNARELKNALEYALLMSESNLIKPSDLPALAADLAAKPNIVEEDFLSAFSEDYSESLEAFEKMYLQSIYERYQGKVNLTARKLGISKTTLIAKTKKYGINTLKLRADASLSPLGEAA